MKITDIMSEPKSRQEYADNCRAMVEDFGRLCKRINHQYVYKHDHYYQEKNPVSGELEWRHDKSGPRIGVVVAYITPEGKLYMGASRCHTPVDKFDRHIGQYQALRNAFPVIGMELRDVFRLVPQSLHYVFAQVFDRLHEHTKC